MGYDVAVIGGGVAGMSVAAHLAPHVHVVVLEAESILGHHSSGRSAALYTECYGPGIVPQLTMASRSFFLHRDRPLATPRGVLFVGTEAQMSTTDALHDRFSQTVDHLERVGHDRALELVPALDSNPQWSGIHEPGAMDIDIHGLESAYRTAVRSHDGDIHLDARVVSMDRTPSGWIVTTTGAHTEADLVVNAAGAWGDVVAKMAGVMPLDLLPLRRSAFLTGGRTGSAHWPMVVDVDEQWYMKPEGPNLLGSAASEIPSVPGDARADELDIALGIERINAATTLGIRSVSSTWAGLRTFTADRLPAVGFDPDDHSFLWLVGQGGFGIKTSPAMARAAAGLVLDRSMPADLVAAGITESVLSPGRFR